MAKFSVALFGHEKPRFYLRSRKTGEIVHQLVDDPGDFSKDTEYYVYECQGWERRAVPGDIVSVRPLNHQWTDREKKEFLIVEIDGLEPAQIGGIEEPEWDLNSYELYQPLSANDWYALMWSKADRSKNRKKALQQLEETKDKNYAEYLVALKMRCAYPKEHLKKRRFGLKQDDLVTSGVNLELMLDPQIIYVPNVSVEKEACFDKLNTDYVKADASLQPIKPLAEAEFKTA